jgi:spermidine synthase
MVGLEKELKKTNWFWESIGEFFQGFQVKKVLFQKLSHFQKIEVFETSFCGRVLVLDGAVQTAEKDEFIYHEMIAHLPLFTHPQPRKVLIIGGGDGGALRQVLKHAVTQVTLVELDKEVIEVAQKFLPAVSQGAFKDSRVKLILENGVEFLDKKREVYDIIIVDSTDPIGAAQALFSPSFYSKLPQVLSENGVFITQSGSPLLQKDLVKQARQGLKQFFSSVVSALIFVPTYPGTVWSLTLASKGRDPKSITEEEIEKRMNEKKIETQYYTPEIHQSCFTLPPFLKKEIEDGG